MKLSVILFCTLFFCAFQGAVVAESDEYISLVALPYVFFNKSYKAFIATSEFKTETDIVVLFRNNRASFKLSPGQSSSQNKIIDFGATDEYIYDDSEESESVPLTISVHRNGKCSRQTADIIDRQQQMFAFIQLDKPVYKPNDVIQYRVVSFDDETKPVQISNIRISIDDGTGFNHKNETTFCGTGHEKFGLFKDTFEIGKDVNLGKWRISAKINDNTFVDKYFPVEEYQLPYYEVLVDHPEVVYEASKKFNVKIFGKYRFGKKANGVAKIQINEIKTDKTIGQNVFEEERINVTREATKVIYFTKDLKIKNLLAPKRYYMVVEFTDNASKSVRSINSNFTVKKNKDRHFEFINPPSLVPGMPYEIQVCVKNFDGKRMKLPNEFVHMKSRIYEGDDDVYGTPAGAPSEKLKNFFLSFKVDTTNATTKLELNFKFINLEKKYEVRVNQTISDELRVIVKEKNPKINAFVGVDINSSDELGVVNLIVFGKFGIATAVTQDCGTDKSCQVQFETNKNMIPKAKVVVYKVKNFDEKVRFGSTTIHFDDFSDNNLKLQLSNSEAQHKKKFKYFIENQKNSYVAVLAIDNSLTFDHKGHDITRTDVIKALTNEEVFEKPSNDIFYDETNQNYVLKVDLNKWDECNDEEKNIFNKGFPGTGGRNSGGVQLYDREAENTKKVMKNKKKFNEKEIRKDFPETWIWDIVYFNKSEIKSFEVIVPDSMTTWLFTAFSVNPEKGFGLADEKKLIVSKEFFIELNTPATLRLGEILKLDLIVFNYVKEEIDEYEGTVTVHAKLKGITHFKFVRVVGSGGSCTIDYLNDTCKEIGDLEFKHNDGTQVDDEELFIEALRNGKMSILVEAEMTIGEKKYSDIVKKEIEVLNEGVAQIISETFEFRHNESTKSLRTFPFAVNDVPLTSVDMTAVISSQIAGPAINFEDKVDISPNGCGEQICSKYARTLYLLDYLKTVGSDTDQFRNKAKKNLNTGSQNLMRYKKKDGSFETFFGTNETSKGSTWMSAYTAKVLGHANIKGIKKENLKIIKDALDFCVKHQQVDGSFEEVGYSKIPSAPLEEYSSRQARFTCFVLISLLKNNNVLKNKYTSNIEKGFEYVLNTVSGDNYYASVCAYALALNGTYSRDNAKTVLSQLEGSIETEGDTKYWDLVKGMKTAPDTKVLIASYVALTYIELNEQTKFRPILNWLVRHRDPNGNFEDSFSTAMAFEAFAAMGKHVVPDDTKMKIKITNQDGNDHFERDVTSQNSYQPIIVPPLPKNSSAIKISAEGVGYVQVQTFFEYYLYIEDRANVFELKVDPRTEIDEGVKRIRICAHLKNENTVTDMIILQLILPSGYVYNADRTNPMKQLSIVKMVETKRADTIVEIYLESLDMETKCLNVYIQKTHDVRNVKKSSVKIYEYSRPSETFSTKFYNVESETCF